MPAGLQIFNEYGTTQVDDRYFSLMLRTKANLTLAAEQQNNWQTIRYFNSLAITAECPVVAISGVLANVYAVQSTGTNTWNVWVQSAISQTVTVYVFDYAKNCTDNVFSSENVGLQVFKENGELVFDSREKPMRVIGVVTADANGNNGSSCTVPTGRSYAVAQSSYGSRLINRDNISGLEPGGLEFGNKWMEYESRFGSTSETNNIVTAGMHVMGHYIYQSAISTQQTDYTDGYNYFFLIDVTGY